MSVVKVAACCRGLEIPYLLTSTVVVDYIRVPDFVSNAAIVVQTFVKEYFLCVVVANQVYLLFAKLKYKPGKKSGYEMEMATR